MSESGWTPGAAEPPTEREDVRPLSHHDSDAHAEGASRPEPAGQDGAAAHVETETESEAKARARSFFAPRGPASAARLNREARFGIAALLSFLILVTVLIVNKGKSHARGEKIPSVAKTDNPQAPPARPAPAPSRAETESPRPGPGPKGTEHAGAPRRAGLPPAPAPIPPPPVMPQPAPLINLGAKPAAGPDEPLHLTEGQDDSVPTPDTTAPDKAVPVVAQPAAVPPSEGSKGPKPERTEGPKSEGAPSP
ncbi:MAG TPA: hypothetical protein VKP69_00650, partial [Isosphaeraceae bacterium]|nr:hypothetical protein [Isosphaeraceae bacterium]